MGKVLFAHCDFAPLPIHQLRRPPALLPAVAKNSAGIHHSGCQIKNATSAGSEPKGSKVADKKAISANKARDPIKPNELMC